MGDAPLSTILAHVVLISTTCGGALWQYYREKKAREWTIEDRRRGIAEARAIRIEAQDREAQERKAATREIIERAEAQAAAMRITTAALAERIHIDARAASVQLAREVADHQAALAGQIEGARVAADRAFDVANNMNGKIADLNDRLVQSLRAANTADVHPDRQ